MELASIFVMKKQIYSFENTKRPTRTSDTSDALYQSERTRIRVEIIPFLNSFIGT